MAAQTNQDAEKNLQDPTHVPPWASGENLRHVEKDVLIPKMVREKAKERCKDLVDEFQKCCKGRSVSMVWHCRQQNAAMKECLTKHFQDPELYEECKTEYLLKRSSYQEDFARTGGTKEMKKKESVLQMS